MKNKTEKSKYISKFRQSKVNNTCVAPKFKKCPNGTQIHNEIEIKKYYKQFY